MATNDLSNKENVVRMYMKELAKKEFPNLDLSESGAFMETFGTPHIKLLTPLLEYADRVKLTQSLDNAELMTTEEMDELGYREFMYRKTGQYATSVVNLFFDDIPSNGRIQISAGVEAVAKNDLRFRCVESLSLDEDQLANYYDPETFRYRIPVLFEAENTGAAYDVEEDEVNRLITPLPHFDECSNPMAFTGGVDRETNVEFANRIRETAMTPNLGVERGYIRFIRSFSPVKDVVVAGYGHPLMKRDVIGQNPPGRFSSNVDGDVHWGGKVDLHIKGKDLVETIETEQVTLNDDNELIVPLETHPVHDVLEIQFSSPQYTDPNLDPSFFYVQDFILMKDENPETEGTLNETAWVVIKDDRLDERAVATVRYRYNKVIQDIENELYLEDNRPPAADVLLKEARQKVMHGAMVVKLESVVGITQNDRSIIRQRLYEYVKDMPMGTELQFSDLTAPIYQVEEGAASTKVDYISLPSQFLLTDHDNKFLYYCLNEEKRKFVDEMMEKSLYFKDWIPYYKDSVTVYDFFDLMHVLTFQNIEKDGWKKVGAKDYIWGKKVYYIELAQRMIAYVSALQRLSPARWKTKENEYFELGNLTIFEDITKTSSDLEQFVRIFESISSPGEDEPITENMLHLVVYCASMLYILGTDSMGGRTVEDLFQWLIDLTKGTPIDYKVHQY